MMFNKYNPSGDRIVYENKLCYGLQSVRELPDRTRMPGERAVFHRLLPWSTEAGRSANGGRLFLPENGSPRDVHTVGRLRNNGCVVSAHRWEACG